MGRRRAGWVSLHSLQQLPVGEDPCPHQGSLFVGPVVLDFGEDHNITPADVAVK